MNSVTVREAAAIAMNTTPTHIAPAIQREPFGVARARGPAIEPGGQVSVDELLRVAAEQGEQ